MKCNNKCCGHCKYRGAVLGTILLRVECRRFPPQGGVNGWAEVDWKGWCGEFKWGDVNDFAPEVITGFYDKGEQFHTVMANVSIAGELIYDPRLVIGIAPNSFNSYYSTMDENGPYVVIEEGDWFREDPNPAPIVEVDSPVVPYNQHDEVIDEILDSLKETVSRDVVTDALVDAISDEVETIYGSDVVRMTGDIEEDEDPKGNSKLEIDVTMAAYSEDSEDHKPEKEEIPALKSEGLKDNLNLKDIFSVDGSEPLAWDD